MALRNLTQYLYMNHVTYPHPLYPNPTYPPAYHMALPALSLYKFLLLTTRCVSLDRLLLLACLLVSGKTAFLLRVSSLIISFKQFLTVKLVSNSSSAAILVQFPVRCRVVVAASRRQLTRWRLTSTVCVSLAACLLRRWPLPFCLKYYCVALSMVANVSTKFIMCTGACVL